MKTNPVRYSFAVGEVWVLATFKVKYCHNIFDFKAIRVYSLQLFEEARYSIRCRKLSFDSDHFHLIWA
ncbi:MAG: hypothetical protein ACTSUP_09830 [Candidatus Heimdallarchaeaceae archaeon]